MVAKRNREGKKLCKTHVYMNAPSFENTLKINKTKIQKSFSLMKFEKKG